MHAMPQVELHNHYMNKNKYARKCNLKYMIHLEEMKCLEIYSAIKKQLQVYSSFFSQLNINGIPI